jgi:hypothetical protein
MAQQQNAGAYHPDCLTGVVRHMPPAEESRKFDVHACEAGMNIKFPGFSCGPRSGHTPIRQSGGLPREFLKNQMMSVSWRLAWKNKIPALKLIFRAGISCLCKQLV